ncbi:MAG: hypothetical protein MUF64_21575 [Polyangiaceae bacterium]|nr:hypothetical protein [Polyangiaceae bacterium]
MKNLLKPLLATAVASCLFGISSEAAAGPLDFDRNSFFILSAERMFGFNYSSTKTEETAGNTTTTTTDASTGIGLLSPSGGNPFSTPSLGLHYSVIPALTVGASLGLTRISTSTTSEQGGTKVETEGDPTTTILFAPRVGYIFGFTNAVYLWARGGISYYRSSTSSEETVGNNKTTTESTNSGLALSLDPMLVITPVNRFGITLGPVFDIGLSGADKTETNSGSTTTTTERDVKTSNYGLQFGILGYL